MNLPDENDVKNAVNEAFKYNQSPESTEIAFFGGSFTAIDRDYMIRLLKTASKLVKEHGMIGIRISTRPDCIDEEILDLLEFYGVTSIELGAQSMDDVVLKLNNRGHTSEDIVNAFTLIKRRGFECGLQMMTGLYGSDYQKDIDTATKIIALKPDTLRVYPTVVFKDTELYNLYKHGEFKPENVEKAVVTCTEIIKMCEKSSINIIKLGLHASEELNNSVAGAYHPAFMELCKSRICLEKMQEKLHKKGHYTVFVNKKDVSIFTGHKRENIEKLEKMGFYIKVKADENVTQNDFIIRE